MPEFVGLSKQEVMALMVNDANIKIKDMLKEREDASIKMIQEEMKKGDKNLWGIASLPFELIFRLQKGILDGFANVQAAFEYSYADWKDYRKHAKTNEDGTTATGDAKIFAHTLSANFQEAIYASGKSLWAGVQQVFGDDEGAKATYEDIELNAKKQDGFRAKIIREAKNENWIKATDINPNPNYFGSSQNSEIVEDYRLDSTKESYDEIFQNQLKFKEDNIKTTKVLSGKFIFGDTYDKQFGEDKMMETIMGSLESVGTIASIAAMTSFANFAGLPVNPAMFQSAYFAAHVYGGAMEEALNNGSDIQDAHVFAISNALLETAVEEISGFKFGEFGTKILGTTVFDMIGEGVEEVIGEFASGGLSYYGSGKKDFSEAPQSSKELLTDSFYAFLGGAMAAGVMGAGGKIMNSNNVNAKAQNIVEDVQKIVKFGDEKKVTAKLDKDINLLVNTLNKKNVRGIKTNKLNRDYMGGLNLEQKKQFVENIKFNKVIEEKNGVFSLSEHYINNKDTMFSVKKDGEAINKEDYGITKAVRGVDIKNKDINITQKENFTKEGKRAFDIFDDTFVPIVFYTTEDGTMDNKKAKTSVENSEAFYDAKEHLIFINEADLKGKTDAEIIQTVLKHEWTHAIENNNKNTYRQMKNSIFALIKDKDFAKIFKTKEYHNMVLQNTQHYKIEATVKINQAIKEGKKYTKDQAKKMVASEVKAKVQAEIVAYFIENFVRDSDFVSQVAIKKPNVFTAIKNAFENVEDTTFFKQTLNGNKKIIREIRNIQKLFNTATRQVAQTTHTLDFFMKHIIGEKNDPKMLFKAEILKDNTPEEIMFAIVNNVLPDGSVKIGDKVYGLSEIWQPHFFSDIDQSKLRMIEEPNKQKIADSFKFDIKKTDTYIEKLEGYVDFLDEKSAKANITIKEVRDIEKIIDILDKPLNKLYDGEVLTKKDKDLISHFMIESIYEESIKFYNENKADYIISPKNQARQNILQTVVKHLKKTSAFGAIKNRNDSVGYAYLMVENNGKGSLEEQIKSTIAGLKYEINSNQALKEYFEVVENGKVEEKIIVERIEPTKLSNDSFYEIAIKVSEKTLKIKEKEIEETILDRQSDTDWRKEQKGLQTTIPNAEETYVLTENMIKDYFEKNDISMENKNIIKVNQNSDLSMFESLEYNDKNIVIGIPAFYKQLPTDFINEAFKIAPIVVMTLPITLDGSYKVQKRITNDAKLIHSQKFGRQYLYIQENMKRPIKTVAQVWVLKSLQETKSKHNLRLLKSKQYQHSEYETYTYHTTLQKELFRKVDFDFFVRQTGADTGNFDILYDRPTDNGKYLLVKAKNKKALQILLSIDYKALAETGSNVQSGFTQYDLFDVYEEFSNNMENVISDGDIQSKVRENSYKLNAKDKAELKKLFGTSGIFDNLVEVDKKGNFIPKNAKFETKYNKIKINGIEYDSDTYAINMPISSTEQDNVVDIHRGYKIVKRADLTNAQEITFEILKTTRVNFVMFEVDMPINSKLHGTVGFSSIKGTTNCVFLNTKFSNKSYNFLVGTLIHEHVHEIFKNFPDIANDLRLQMGKILFDAKGKKTAIYDLLDTLYDGDFKKYMVQGYPTLHMSSISKIHNVLTAQNLNNAELKGANEVTAQVIGTLFGNYEGFAEILQGDVNSLVAMNQLLDKMATNSNINSNEQTILSKTLTTVRDAFNVYVDNLEKKYPSNTRPQTVAEQNAFIKSFSNEKYNTVADLLNKYSQERKAHIRGDAVITLENVIYIASSFGETIQQGLNSFKELAEEFQEFKNSIEYMLNNSNEINKIFDKKIITLKNVIIASLKKFNILSKKNILSNFEQAKMADILNDIQLATNELQELYGKLDSKLLELMDFQAKDLIEAKLQVLSDAINQILLDYSNGKDIKKGDLVQLYTDYTTYVKHTIENIKILDENTVSLFAKVATLYRNYNDMKHQKFSNAINSVSNTLTSHLKSTRDGRAPLNELLQTIYDLLFGKDYAKQDGVVKKLIGLNQIILDTTYDVDTMREEVIPIIDKIRDTLSQEKNNLDDKHKQEINLALLQIYTQLAIFFNDINILKKGVEGKFKIKDSAKVEYLGRFNENKVANAFKAIIKNVYTEHISIFSLKQNEDLDAYALKTIEEINTMEKPIDLFGMVALRNFYLPQQFFRALAEATEGQVHFFRAFYEEYVKASFAASDVEAEALRSKTAHMKKHKNVMIKSKEVHSISAKFLAKTTLTEFQYKQSGIEENLKKLKAEKKDLGDKYSEKRIKKLELQAEIKDLQAKYQKIKNTGTDVQKKALLQEITSKTNEVIKIKDDMKSNAILRQAKQQEIEKNSIEIKMAEAALQEAIQRKKDKKVQELEVGIVVSLLQSVKREIQMKEMQENDESYISPTDHFEYLNIVQVSDNDLAIKKGTETAQSQAQSFIIMAKTKQELVDYLESWLKEHAEQEAQIMLDYAQERFDTNYENLNRVYKLTYGVELPRQSIFIPFKTLQSNTDRTFEIKNYGSTNLGVARGLILKTTEGANTMLDIQNIYATIDNHTRATAKYQFDRLITDYQNLLVNKVKKGTIQAMLKESEGKFGANGGIIEQNINDMLGAILGYNKSYSRLLRKAYILGMVSKIFLAIPMFLRQFISISTISIRQQLNPLEMAYYIVETLFDKKTENWLLMNNSNFALRKMNKNLPTLAQLTGEGFTEDGRNALKKIISATGGHISWSDNAILIAAYKAILRKITKADPSIKSDSIKMEQARHQANEQFKDVLLFDVANTETAFRGLASNKKDGVSQFWTMWQGESFMQVGGILTAIMKVRNNVNGSRSELAILTTRFLASAMFSALINVFAAKVIFPRDDDDEESVLNFFLQDFFWDNIIGGIPWITTFTSLIELSSEGVGKGFDTTIPIYTDIMNIRDKMLEMKHDGSKKDWIKVVKVLESIGNLTGIPIRNAVKILAGTTRLFDNGEESVMNDMSLFFRNKTRTEALNIAVRKGDKEQVQNYMASIFKDNDVKSELMKLMIENPKEKLSFYSQNSFKKKNEDGTFSTYKIPDNVMEKYNALAQRTLRYLIKNPTYRKLSAKEKIKSIQRIINYYYGYKKSIVLKNEKELVDMNILIEKAVIHKKEEQ